MSSPISAVYLLVGAAVAGLLVYTRARRLPLPPGPSTSWTGRVDIPKQRQWEVYANEWKKLYGDLIYVNILGSPLLILNSAEVMDDLLEKRSNKYSSRPVRTMVVELMGWDWLFSSFPYGSWWRQHRAIFKRYFHPKLVHKYRPVQLQETHTLLRNLLNAPDDFRYGIRRWGAAIVLTLAYGHQVAEKGDDYVSLADRALNGLQSAGIFGTYLVDYVPALKYIPAWFPGAGFQRQAKVWRKDTVDMAAKPYLMVERWLQEGGASTAAQSFVASELESPDTDLTKAEMIKNVGATIYAAGADTTVSSVLSFILAMALHPDIAKKAQAEIDSVVGDRLPQFSDSLPYVDCIAYELLRWHPVTPLGLARTVSEEDEYRGFRIPKGTTLLPNVWGVLHDPKVYPEPLSFNPERFADAEGNNAARINPAPDAAFGFGRRMCPGRWLAFQSIWIAVASILAVYDILLPLDEQGKEIKLPEEYTTGLLNHPKPFSCRIVPRSSKAVNLVRQTADNQA
ncbi:cytochrome P450 [Pleurotus eryngii]|uniref:Cytochrome P450 n=1 Tax=Pleurotus eryngii TaxID=5323 RepID=A0A9P6DAW3_PLEER|nr:cytochrome P450 [Pleurotus eryngii]